MIIANFRDSRLRQADCLRFYFLKIAVNDIKCNTSAMSAHDTLFKTAPTNAVKTVLERIVIGDLFTRSDHHIQVSHIRFRIR